MPGPFGHDSFEFASDAFPHALRDLRVRAGIEGPQAVLTWGAPRMPITRLMIRRKLEEYPQDPGDGVLVVDEIAAPNTRTSAVDVGVDLLDAGAAQGAGRWWYYRAFVVPAPLPLADQIGGEANQIVLVPLQSRPWDLQAVKTFSVVLENSRDVGAVALTVQTGPELDGPWVDLRAELLAPGETARCDFTDASYKFVRVSSSNDFVRVTLIAVRPQPWMTGEELSRACYVFRSGRHHRVAWELGHLPQFYALTDAEQVQVTVGESGGLDGELHNLGIEQETSGPLKRFLRVLLAEMDRVHAYLESVREWDTHPDEMPPEVAQHVAVELGYPLEFGQRDLRAVREELFRVAGFWKTKGTVALVEAVCEQVLGCVARVQTGAGRVMRVTNPNLFDKPPGQVDQNIGN